MDKLKLDGLLTGSSEFMQPSHEDLTAVAAFWQGKICWTADQEVRACVHRILTALKRTTLLRWMQIFSWKRSGRRWTAKA